jgi:hypothetical protein
MRPVAVRGSIQTRRKALDHRGVAQAGGAASDRKITSFEIMAMPLDSLLNQALDYCHDGSAGGRFTQEETPMGDKKPTPKKSASGPKPGK